MSELYTTTKATYEFEFDGLAQLSKAIYSPVFSSGSDHLWQLWIQPAETLKDGEEYLSLYLCVIPNANEIKTVEPWRERMLTTATVYLTDPKTHKPLGNTISYTNKNLKKFSIRCSYRGREFFVKRSLIPHTKLILGIEFLNVPFIENYVSWNDNNFAPPESLVYSWGTAVDNPRMADVLFKVQGEILCANKEIVCGRSEYFKAMFASGCVESRMISAAECGRLRKRLRDSTGSGRKQSMESSGEDIENMDKKRKHAEIKNDERRITKKQRSTHTENGPTSLYVTSNHDVDEISISLPQNDSTSYRNDSNRKIDDNNIQIDDNNDDQVINRNVNEIPESIVKSKSGIQENIVGKQVVQQKDRISLTKNSGPEVEVDEEFLQYLVNNRNVNEIPESIVKSKSGIQENVVGKQVVQQKDRISPSVVTKNSGPEAEVDEEFPQDLPDLPPGFYHVVNITDCDVPTFYSLLHYLYTNEIIEPEGPKVILSLVDLFRLADKYQITDLRQRALARIYKELAISNVAEVLFSSGHQWPDLKKVCMDYILKHFATVRETEGFNKVMEHPENYVGFSEIAKDLFKKLKITDDS